jgi:hypothetical protein
VIGVAVHRGYVPEDDCALLFGEELSHADITRTFSPETCLLDYFSEGCRLTVGDKGLCGILASSGVFLPLLYGWESVLGWSIAVPLFLAGLCFLYGSMTAAKAFRGGRDLRGCCDSYIPLVGNEAYSAVIREIICQSRKRQAMDPGEVFRQSIAKLDSAQIQQVVDFLKPQPRVINSAAAKTAHQIGGMLVDAVLV